MHFTRLRRSNMNNKVYFDYNIVIKAFENLIVNRKTNIHNGIIAFHYVIKNSSGINIFGDTLEIHFDEKAVTNDINHHFSFQENKPTVFASSNHLIAFSNFHHFVFNMIGKEPIDLLSLAIVSMQTESFDRELDADEVINTFVKKFNFPEKYISTCMLRKNNSVTLKYTTELIKDDARKRKVENIFKNKENKTTIDFSGKWMASLGGSFGAGAYAQRLVTTSGLKNLFYVPSSNLQKSLGYVNRTKVSKKDNYGKNVLLIGPSGVGKSTIARKELILNKGVKQENISQITFHQHYSYNDFIGGIKPSVLFQESDKKIYLSDKCNKSIYEDRSPVTVFNFDAGPFIRSCIKAANDNPETPHAIIIDELNRGNTQEIFGDVFQLLDRVKDVYSSSNEDLIRYLNQECDNDFFSNGLIIPDNLLIYSTINPSDQNTYVLDTAFKRRWMTRFIDIDYEHESTKNWYLTICQNNINWSKFIKIINKFIIHKLELSEDKQLGQFFINIPSKPKKEEISSETIKVISYLWEDIPKRARKLIFSDRLKTFGDISNIISQKHNLDKIFSDELSTLLEE